MKSLLNRILYLLVAILCTYSLKAQITVIDYKYSKSTFYTISRSTVSDYQSRTTTIKYLNGNKSVYKINQGSRLIEAQITPIPYILANEGSSVNLSTIQKQLKDAFSYKLTNIQSGESAILNKVVVDNQGLIISAPACISGAYFLSTISDSGQKVVAVIFVK